MTGSGPPSRGYLYITTGEEFISEAVESAERIRSVHEDPHISLYADQDPDSDVFDDVYHTEDPKYSHEDKVNLISESPYDETIFLDSDTYPCSDISELFDLLDRFEFAAAHDTGRRRELYKDDDVSVNAPDAFPMVNSGVMVFENTDAVNEVFDLWKDVYRRHRKKVEGMANQPALREALFHTDVSMTVLPPEFNCRTPYPTHVRGPVKLIHGRNNQQEVVCRDLNASDSEVWRTFYVVNMGNKTEVLVHPGKWHHRLKLLKLSVTERGVIETARKLLTWTKGGDFH